LPCLSGWKDVGAVKMMHMFSFISAKSDQERGRNWI
jgi:hypothetical protein